MPNAVTAWASIFFARGDSARSPNFGLVGLVITPKPRAGGVEGGGGPRPPAMIFFFFSGGHKGLAPKLGGPKLLKWAVTRAVTHAVTRAVTRAVPRRAVSAPPRRKCPAAP